MRAGRVTIGISGTIPDDAELNEDGLDEEGLRYLVRSVARELLAAGADLVYGTYGKIADELKLAFAQAHATAGAGCGRVKLILLKDEIERFGEKYKFAELVASEYLENVDRQKETKEALEAFRRKELIPSCRALLCVGGRLRLRSDRPHGVGQEVEIAQEAGLPVYLLATGGGFTREFFEREIASRSSANSAAPHERDRQGQNGLTFEEDLRFGTTTDAGEAASLVVRGLQVVLGGLRPETDPARGATAPSPVTQVRFAGAKQRPLGDLGLLEFESLVETEAVESYEIAEHYVSRSSKATEAAPIDVAERDVFELVWKHVDADEDEGRLVTEWVSAPDLSERFGLSAVRGEGGVLTLPSRLMLQDTTRGLRELLLVAFKKIRVALGNAVGALVDELKSDLGEKAFESSVDKGVLWKVRRLEKKLVPQPGLFSVSDNPGGETLALAELPADWQPAGPLLVLLHGTASNTKNAFVGFRTDDGKPAWSKLRAAFGPNVVTLEHYTLTQSPVQNALELAMALPAGAELHLLSHSRGGLVGELLCLPYEGEGSAEVHALIDRHFQGSQKRAGEQLRELLQVLQEKRFVLKRFARVACPAAGTLLASKRLDRYLGGAFGLLQHAASTVSPVLSGAVAFLKSVLLTVVSARTRPEVLPGLEAMMPRSGLVSLLAATPPRTGAELLAVAGDFNGEGVLGRLKSLFSDLYYWRANDFVVDTASMLKGIPRTQARQLNDSGPKTDHFSYFKNPQTATPIADWLGGTEAHSVKALVQEPWKRRDDPHLSLPPTASVDLTGLDWETTTLLVEVEHGDLRSTPHDNVSRPLLLSFYARSKIIPPLALVDGLLANAISRRLPPVTHGLVSLYQGVHPTLPGGAVVVGLGEARDLTRSGLSAAVANAVVEQARADSDNWSPGDAPVEVHLDTLLLGQSINGSLSVRDSVRALIDGALTANRRLAEEGRSQEVRIVGLRFVELYEGVANLILEELKDVADVPSGVSGGRERVLLAHDQLQRRDGGRPGWPRRRLGNRRMTSVEVRAKGDVLTYDLLSNLARAERHSRRIRPDNLELLLEAARRRNDPDARRALFQYLLPLALSERLQPSDMLMILSPEAAELPWELLESHDDGRRPLATRYGLVRQLRTDAFRERPTRSADNRALVIGEPSGVAPPLRAAHQEAVAMVELLRHEFEMLVTSSIHERPAVILKHLYRDQYDLIHIAAHGRADAKGLGVLLGGGMLLTAKEFRNLRAVPSLVFLNCCHLGLIDGKWKVRMERPERMAAGLARELIDMGVRAVVVAAWAVNDLAARDFAQEFYRHLASAECLVDAVRRARETTYERHPRGNTWAAYQVYGDPGFLFTPQS